MPDQFGNPTLTELLATPNVDPSQIPAGFAQGGLGLPPTPANVEMYRQASTGPDPNQELGNIQSILQRYQQPAPNFLQRLAINLGSNPQGVPQSGGQGFAQGLQNAFVNAQMSALKRRQAMAEAMQSAGLEIAKTGNEEARQKQKMAQQSLLETARQRENSNNILQREYLMSMNGVVPFIDPITHQPVNTINGTPAVIKPGTAGHLELGSAAADRGDEQLKIALARLALAQAAAQKSQGMADPDVIGSQVNTDMMGNRYIDMSMFPAKNRGDVLKFVKENDTPESPMAALDGPGAKIVGRLDELKMNNNTLKSQLQQFAPKDWMGRPIEAAKVKLSQVLQSDPTAAAYMSNSLMAIQYIATLAIKPGSGARINQAEIQRALQYDFPKATDALPTAMQKLDNLNTMAEHVRTSLMVKNRSTLPGGVNEPALNSLAPGFPKPEGTITVTGPDGKSVQRPASERSYWLAKIKGQKGASVK